MLERFGSRQSLLTLVVLTGALLLTGCAENSATFMSPQGAIAAAQKAHLIRVTAITMIAVFPVLILVPWMLWRYRYKNPKARYAPDWDFSGPLDLVMWGVPLIIIVVLSFQLWSATKTLDPYRPIDPAEGEMRVHVIGLDWKWLFVYPDLGIATVGEVAFPANEPVVFEMTSDSVMQSFAIGALAGQIYVMPGMTTALHVEADQTGTFVGKNMQFSGKGFAEQKFNAKAMSPVDFDAWVAQVRQEGRILDAASYAVLAEPSTKEQAQKALDVPQRPGGVIYFNAIPSDLLSSVRGRYTSGKPVDAMQQPGSPTYQTRGTP
ncbi:MAG: cytochrome ubiquinol oxidase subunit II [Sulfitobacter sp.]|uniref:cytochrome ubiquinol oxidase subunit II n=1 Tax=Sulfitobacter sp. TaxID=1903071 RepID=UPI004059A578